MKHPPHTPKTKLAKKSMPKPFTDAWLQELQEQLHQHAALANEIQAGGLIVDRQNAAFWLAGAYYWLWLTTDRAFERIAATRHLTQNEIQRAETLHAAYQELKELSQQPPTAPGDPRNALTAAGLRKTLDRITESFALAPPPAKAPPHSQPDTPPGDWLMPPMSLQAMSDRLNTTPKHVKTILAPYGLRHEGSRQSWTVCLSLLPQNYRKQLQT